MAIPFYYNPATNELELTANPSPLRTSVGERFGLEEIFTARETLSPTKSYAKDWRKDEDWDDKGPWDIPPKDPFKDLDWDDRVDMKPGGIVEPGVTNYAKFGSEEIAKFKKMRAAGATGEEIFKKIGMSIPHQQYLKKKLNLPAIKVNPAHFKPVELTAKMKKYVKDFETESGEKYKNQTADTQYSIRQGTWAGQLSVTDPERLLKIKKYIEKFKKNNGELPTVNEVRQHFQKTINKDLEKPIKAAMKKYNIVLPSGFGRQSAEIVDADIRKLLKNKSILKTLDAGKFPTDSQIQSILKVDRTLAETRSIDLANTLKGTRVIRLFEAPKKYKSLATSFLKSQEGTDAYKPKMRRSRMYHEKALTKLLDLSEPINKIRSSIINKITSFIPEAKGLLHVDEIAGLTSSMRRGSGPYAIFGQVVGSDFNSIVKALTIDKDKGIAEKKLVKLAKDDPERIVTQKKYNQKIIDFEREANKNNPAKKVRGFKLSFKHPSDAIKNKNVYLKYKKLFDTHFKKYGFSWEVPADREAIPEILKKLDNKDFQKVVRNRFLKIAGKGGKTGALVALATLAGTGWALADDKTLETDNQEQEDRTAVFPYDIVSAIAEDPKKTMSLAAPIAAGAAIVEPKKALEIAKQVGTKAGSGFEKVIRPLFIPAVDVGAAFVDTPITSKEHHRDVTSPTFWMTKAFWAGAMDKYGITRTFSMLKNAPNFPEKARILRDIALRGIVLNPKAVRAVSKIAWPATAAASVYDSYKDYQRRKPDIEKQKELIKKGVIKEEEFDKKEPMFAMGGIASLIK